MLELVNKTSGSAQHVAPFDHFKQAFGIGLRREHYAEFRNRDSIAVDFLEIISENFFFPRPRALLETLSLRYPIHMHGVSLSIGSADPLDLEYLKKIRDLCDLCQPVVVSDHLCWTGVNGINTHDLLPLQYTQEVLEHLIPRVQFVQDYLQRDIALENPSSYVYFENQDYDEAEFLALLSQKTGCKILLDINNVFVSASNHSFDALDYIAKIPGEKIAQYHIAGHTDLGTHIVDTHTGPVPPTVINLAQLVLPKLNQAPVVLEWDTEVPTLDVLLGECERLRSSIEEGRPRVTC